MVSQVNLSARELRISPHMAYCHLSRSHRLPSIRLYVASALFEGDLRSHTSALLSCIDEDQSVSFEG